MFFGMYTEEVVFPFLRIAKVTAVQAPLDLTE